MNSDEVCGINQVCPITPPVPRLLGVRLAAAYLGLSERGFDMRWRNRTLPQPHRIGRRLLWDRKLLDMYVDALSEIDGEQVSNNDGW